jgi:hypothetical protein
MMDDPLPAALSDRLSAAALKSLQESLREKRLALLAAGLGLSEAGALDALARATGLPALDAPQADKDALALLPARLAHEFQVVPVLASVQPSAVSGQPEDTSGFRSQVSALHLATAWPPNATIADWIATFTPRPLVWHVAPSDRVRGRRGRRRRPLRHRGHRPGRRGRTPPTSISSRRKASCASATASTACSCPCPCRKICSASRTRSSPA